MLQKVLSYVEKLYLISSLMNILLPLKEKFTPILLQSS